MKCPHKSFRWVCDEDFGDRVIKHMECRECGHPRKRNLKKPRFVPRKRTLARKAPKVSPLSKTLPNPRKRQRKAIRQVSDKKQRWNALYEAKKKADGDFVTAWDMTPIGCAGVIRMHRKDLLEAHHPLGRVGCRILFYRWVTPTLHEWIHKRAELAREEGLILPEMSGRESGPEQPDPFNILSEYRAYVAEHGLH